MRFPMVASRVRIVVAVAALGLRAGCTFGQAITEFPIPAPGASPVDIVAGPDGNLWFTELYSGRIGRLSVGGVLDQFQVPTPRAWLWSITAGPDGNLWFTEASVSGDVGTGKIGRITPLGVATEFPTPSLLSAPHFITAGPDGNLWFTDTETSYIGKVTTDGVITAFPVGVSSVPQGITAGPDGNLWFTEALGNRIGRMTPAGEITEFNLPAPDSWPYEITTGPDGNLWFTEQAGKIGRITTDGVVTEFLSGLNFPAGIATGSDGNLWFLEGGANKVWRLTTDGAGTSYPIPTSGSGAFLITSGPDGALWFTEYDAGKIGRITTVPPPVATVDAIAPASGSSAGGMSIYIFGSGFQAGATVTFGVPASDVVVESETLITATVPLRAPGTLTDVVVTNPDGATGTLPQGWFADFLDVDGSDGFHGAVEKIFRKGITAGCGGGDVYCRNNPVSRAQMAVFLLKTEHGSAYAPPDCGGVFPDVACPGMFVNWIEQLAAEGITGGCGGGNYCPDAGVTRQQMAVFLLKTEHGPSYSPPDCAGLFEDVACPGVFADWIEQLAAEQVTGGCSVSPALYCPESAVTRGQMAVFLTKTFGLQ